MDNLLGIIFDTNNCNKTEISSTNSVKQCNICIVAVCCSSSWLQKCSHNSTSPSAWFCLQYCLHNFCSFVSLICSGITSIITGSFMVARGRQVAVVERFIRGLNMMNLISNVYEWSKDNKLDSVHVYRGSGIRLHFLLKKLQQLKWICSKVGQ